MLIIVQELIQKYFLMEDGEHIKDFHNEIEISNSKHVFILKHRVLKHIVEQRKRDGYSENNLLQLFMDIEKLAREMRYMIIQNPKETNSHLFIEHTPQNNTGVVLVLEIMIENGEKYYIKTGFYRAATKIKKLL